MIEVTHQRGVFRVTYKGKTQYVMIAKVEFIEADEWLCRLNTANDVIVCGMRLGLICEKLAAYGFVRCHKGFAVNVRNIEAIRSHEIELKGGRMIPIGRVYKKSITAAYEDHIKKSDFVVNSHLKG